MEKPPTVWAITGFKRETFDNKGKVKLVPDWTLGKLHANTETIMHGQTWVEEAACVGYAYLNISWQKMEDFENMPLAERGLGAVSGGFILTSHFASSEPFEEKQEWGVIDASKIYGVSSFKEYNAFRYNRVMVSFDRTNVTPVSAFCGNGAVIAGLSVRGEKTDWGLNIKSNPGNFKPGNYAVVVEKVTSTVVLKAEFPQLLAGDAEKTILPEVMFSRVFTNGSSVKAKDTFTMNTTLLDTHTFVFEDGWGVDWSEGWKAKVPLLSEANTTGEVEVSFSAHQPRATSKTQAIDRTTEVSLTPMTGCRATARYMKSVLTVNAILTVEKTYTNGAVETRKVPAKYTSVSCDSVEIMLEGVPVVPTSVQ